MKSPRKPKTQKRAKQGTPPKPTSKKVLFVIFGSIGLVLVVMLLIVHVVATLDQTNSVNALAERWKHEFQLGDVQVATLKKLELEFHGSGDPFTRPGRSLEETQSHHIRMSEVVAPEFREKFLSELNNR